MEKRENGRGMFLILLEREVIFEEREELLERRRTMFKDVVSSDELDHFFLRVDLTIVQMVTQLSQQVTRQLFLITLIDCQH